MSIFLNCSNADTDWKRDISLPDAQKFHSFKDLSPNL
jgi:hypothetical protein